MFSRAPVIKCMILALLFWACDSLLLSFSSGLPFLFACWQGAGAARLMIRLIVSILLLLLGFILVLRREIRYRQYKKLPLSTRDKLFGNKDSSQQPLRLQYYALRLSVLLGMRTRDQDRLRLLCWCYDIGLPLAQELDTPENPALSSGRDGHARIGAQIALAMHDLAPIAHLIACHEERYDGQGPEHKFGRSIPLSCRILRIILLYDSLVHPEKGEPMSNQEALDELNLYSGTVLDPEVLAVFYRLQTDNRVSEACLRYVVSKS